MTDAELEVRALAALDPEALTADLVALVRVPSVGGREREAMELLGRQAQALGLRAELEELDLDALRAHPDHPGEEVARDEVVGVKATLLGLAGRRPRLALCGHLDVVLPGTVPWTHGPWSATIADGRLHGRGAVDMKAGVAAALHAMGAVVAAGGEPPCVPVLLGVAGEEDGGIGAFATLQADRDYAGCVITEPTGMRVVCAQAGALTFTGTVEGVAAHAAHRLEGASAVDRYVPVHTALAALEHELNAEVANPLMAVLELPYPLQVGRVVAGEWSSTVPDRLTFEGRAPVRIGEAVADVRAAVEDAVVAAGAGHVTLEWTGGQFASGATDPDGPLARTVLDAARAEVPGATTGGVPWGADLRLFTAAGVPTVMLGTSGIERSHAVDEWVDLAEVTTLARALVRTICRFPGG